MRMYLLFICIFISSEKAYSAQYMESTTNCDNSNGWYVIRDTDDCVEAVKSVHGQSLGVPNTNGLGVPNGLEIVEHEHQHGWDDNLPTGCTRSFIGNNWIAERFVLNKDPLSVTDCDTQYRCLCWDTEPTGIQYMESTTNCDNSNGWYAIHDTYDCIDAVENLHGQSLGFPNTAGGWGVPNGLEIVEVGNTVGWLNSLPAGCTRAYVDHWFFSERFVLNKDLLSTANCNTQDRCLCWNTEPPFNPNICTCAHGVAASGVACTVTGELCVDCYDGYNGNTCTENVCSCPNGVAETGEECTTNGDRICASCNPGYDKTEGGGFNFGRSWCTGIVCSCPNGNPTTTTACTLSTRCVDCFDGYYKTGGTCHQNVCNCANGVAATGAACTTNGANICASCSSEYYKSGNTCTACTACDAGEIETDSCSSASNRVCTQNVCSCANGVEATGAACTTNGANICASCSSEYYKTGDTCTGCTGTCGAGETETTQCSSASNRVCTQNVCSCANGVAATGTACATNNANICSSCSSEYYKTGDTCTGCTTCDTGTRETIACSLASNRVCTQNVCSCANGVEETGTACTTHDANICSSCSSEYYKTGNTCTGCTACGIGTHETTSCSSLANRVCALNTCSCSGGTAAEGEACATHGAIVCTDCPSNYYKDGSGCIQCTVCGGGFRTDSACTLTSDRTCVQKICSCANGVAATGEDCTTNGANICASCSSEYYKTGDTCTGCTTCGAGERETTSCSLSSNRVCTQNVCFCANGVKATGTACTTNNANICLSCSSEYYKTGDTCSSCTTCDTGFTETTACSSASNRVCTQNVCSCANGDPVTGAACTTHNANICTSCSSGYYKTGNTCTECTTCGAGFTETTACSSASNRVCAQNTCSCANGNPVTGAACTTHNANNCTSCSSGYYKTGGVCTACTTCDAGEIETTPCTMLLDTVCTPYVCSCANGVAATGADCTTNGANICVSCSSEYYKTGDTCTACTVCGVGKHQTTQCSSASDRVCTQNVCSCANGNPATGAACTTHDASNCAATAYASATDGGTCREGVRHNTSPPIGRVWGNANNNAECLASALAPSGAPTTFSGSTNVIQGHYSTLPSGCFNWLGVLWYNTYENSPQKCVMPQYQCLCVDIAEPATPVTIYPCSCANGVAASWGTCTTVGNNICSSCDNGFHGAGVTCHRNVCYCANGVAVTGTACTTNGANICASCSGGLYKAGGTCHRNVCSCANGNPVTGAACTTHNANICTSCSGGFHKAGVTCTQNVCSCANGNPATGAACTTHGANICMPVTTYPCSCTNGVAASLGTCTTDGANVCSSCNSEYYKTGNTCTVCITCGAGFTETTPCSSASNRVCTQNVCTCANGVIATGTSCTTDGANVCSSCNSEYYKTGNTCTGCITCGACETETTACSSASNRVCGTDGCTQNVCTCANGVAATGTACTTDGANICSSCNSEYYKTGNTCTGCITCGAGETETTACSSASNRVCGTDGGTTAYASATDGGTCREGVRHNTSPPIGRVWGNANNNAECLASALAPSGAPTTFSGSTNVIQGHYSTLPSGCFNWLGVLWYNTYENSPQKCVMPQYQCLCVDIAETATPVTIYPCSCINGVAASLGTCTTVGNNVCSSCDSGFHKAGVTCHRNVCSCANGVAVTGTSCAAPGANICSSCSGEYYKTGNTCTGCITCGAGETETTACSSASNRVCTQNVCTCANGNPATGAACTTHGANICSSCSSEYYKTGNTCTGCTACGIGTHETIACSSASNRVCTQNVCSCANGVEATGAACTTHDANICSSCSSEYYKTGNTCTGCTTCGVGKRETTQCTSASNRVCTQNVCSCANGVAATGTACTTHDANICSSCSSEYYKTGNTCTGCTTCGVGKRETTQCTSASNRVCTQNVCSCANGVAATGTACTTHDANICSSCSSEYYKTGDTCTGCVTTNGICSTCTTADASGCTVISSCDANKFDTNNIAQDGCEDGCVSVPNGLCTTCSDTTTCAAVVCDANKFDTNNVAQDGCEDGCTSVPNGLCTACKYPRVSGCTAVSCTVNNVDSNNDPTDGCETQTSLSTYSPLHKTSLLLFPLIMFLLLMISSVISKRKKLQTNKSVFQQSIQPSNFVHRP